MYLSDRLWNGTGGLRLALLGTMNQFSPLNSPRHKAVWGPKRTLAVLALVGLVAPLGLSANSNTPPAPPSRHRFAAPVAPPGLPSGRVDNSKLDKDLQLRKTA